MCVILKFARASIHECLFFETEDVLNMKFVSSNTREKHNIHFPCLIFLNKIFCLSHEKEKSL